MRRFVLVAVGAGIGAGSMLYNPQKQGFTGGILGLDRGGKIASGATAP